MDTNFTSDVKKGMNMSAMPLGPRHIFIVLVASMGQFIGQGLATLVGIVIPLIQLAAHPELSAARQGLLGCVSLIGIMFGTVAIGRLSDRYGYLTLFRICPLVIASASLLVIFVHSYPILVASLFIMGFAIGGEYSLDPDYISELMPDKWRTLMVGFAKALASAGSAVVAVICYFMIMNSGKPEIWPDMFVITAIAGLLMFISRIPFARSPQWLADHGRDNEAEEAVRKFLGKNVYMDIKPSPAPATRSQNLWTFIKNNLRDVILTGVPWACEGLGVYGIGIFLPVLIMSFKIDSLPASAPAIEHITHSVGLTLALSVVMVIGFAGGLMIMRRFNHLRQQIIGFLGCVVGLGILLAAYILHWPSWIAITGFVIFELALNAGPHLITFILPSQVFPVDDRGTGAGIAAGIGKAGAVIGAFIIPVMLHTGGPVLVLIVTIAVMALGALITLLTAKK